MTASINVRLRRAKVPEDCLIAVKWYQDPEVLYYSEGPGIEPYNLDVVQKMYEYLSSIGTLYIIEVEENQKWIPAGDATLAKDTLPVVIGEARYRSRGVGKIVLHMLIEKAKHENWDQLRVNRSYVLKLQKNPHSSTK